MIRATSETDHVALYAHSGKVWFVSSKGMVQPMDADIAEAVGLEMFQQARRLKKRISASPRPRPEPDLESCSRPAPIG
jgi:hypothetical protein